MIKCIEIVKQAVNKQECDKVPSIVICIQTLTAKSLCTVNNVIILVSIKFFNKGGCLVLHKC